MISFPEEMKKNFQSLLYVSYFFRLFPLMILDSLIRLIFQLFFDLLSYLKPLMVGCVNEKSYIALIFFFWFTKRNQVFLKNGK